MSAVAITNLLYTYANLIDDGDFAGIGELFADASIVDEQGQAMVSGATDIQAMYESTTRRYPCGTPLTQHVISNPVITIDNHAAICKSRFTVFQKTDELALQPIITGKYHDTFSKSAAGTWHFTSRHMSPVLIGDLSKHLLIDL